MNKTTQNQLEKLVEERRKLIDPNNNSKIISVLSPIPWVNQEY